jgi:hypothetical protein
MRVHEFADDDRGYVCWVRDNPSGFVLNVRRNPGPNYTVLHRATCQTIARPRDDGSYTGRGYLKVVAGSVDELRRFTRSLGRADGSFSGACGHCDPLGS